MFFSFRGGIHPPENKERSAGNKFSNLSIPHECLISLQQHIGSPAKPVVEIGDIVKEGQLIAESTGFISANIHASIPGKITDIIESSKEMNGAPIIKIEAEGEFSSFSPSAKSINWNALTSEEILNKIKKAGIVGMGGASFPTNVKLNPPPDKTITTLVINGAECEPYLTVDDMMMQTFPEQIIEGIRITLKVLGIKDAIIGIEDNKKNSIKILKKLLSDNEIDINESIKVAPLKTLYPQGSEKQLIYSLLKKEVPSGGLPMDVGIVVQNISTIFAIREAVLFDKPLFERYITVSGKMIKNPGNYKVKIGTKISDIIQECGGLTGDPERVINGGPMCGTSLYNMDSSITKGTSGILFLSKDETHSGNFTSCIRCGKCVSVCPAGLLPADIGLAVEKNEFDLVKDLNTSDCIMCSSCSYVCPSNRPLSHFIKLAQERLRSKK
jgi:H+/Na+-translocating ferredoxin:NAD+ oxidoreductase subunit C